MRVGNLCSGLALGLGLVVVIVSLSVGCPDKVKHRGPDAATSEKPQVLVSTKLKNPRRLTLGDPIPTSPRPTSQQVGQLRFTAQLCDISGAMFLTTADKSALLSVALLDRKLYVLDHERALRRFDIAPGAKCLLTLDKSWGDGGVFRSKLQLEKLSTGGTGGQPTLVASSYLGSVVVRDGRVAYTCRAKDQGRVTLHPGGGWGLASFSGSDVQRLVFGPTACRGARWHLTDLKDDARRKGPFRLVSGVGFIKDLVLVGGSLAIRVGGWHPQVVVAFDNQGRRRFQLGALTGSGPDRFQWVGAIHACGPRQLCVLDPSANRLSLWGPAGQFLGAVSLGKLLGQPGAMVSDFTVDPQGVAFLTTGAKPRSRSRSSSGSGKRNTGLHEGFIFRLRGPMPRPASSTP